MKPITKDKYSSKTMTVKELIEKLLEYPMSTPVLATWDDLRVGIRPENFYIENRPVSWLAFKGTTYYRCK